MNHDHGIASGGYPEVFGVRCWEWFQKLKMGGFSRRTVGVGPKVSKLWAQTVLIKILAELKRRKLRYNFECKIEG